MIKAIAFDYGGVLVGLDVQRSAAAFKALGFSDIESYLDPYLQKGVINEMESGRISEAQFYEEALRHCAPGTTEAEVRSAMEAMILEPNRPVLDFIRNLLDSGFDNLYIFSNNNPICTDACRRMLDEEGLPMDKTFRKTFFSQQIRLCKPTDEFFRYVIAEVGCLPGEILFIDDAPANVEAARRNGINAMLYPKI